MTTHTPLSAVALAKGRSWAAQTLPISGFQNLTATFAKSSIHLSQSQQRRSHFSNRSKIDCSRFNELNSDVQPLARPKRDVVAKAGSNAPKQDGVAKAGRAIQLPDSNRPSGRLEFNISPTKQTTAALSNRSKYIGSPGVAPSGLHRFLPLGLLASLPHCLLHPPLSPAIARATFPRGQSPGDFW